MYFCCLVTCFFSHNEFLVSLIQVLGAAWYLLSVDRYKSCWKSNCKDENDPIKCFLNYLDCDTFNHGDRKTWAKSTNVFKNCDPNNNISFDYGIFKDAVSKTVVSSKFIEKYFYCLWWGLQQLRYLLYLRVPQFRITFAILFPSFTFMIDFSIF